MAVILIFKYMHPYTFAFPLLRCMTALEDKMQAAQLSYDAFVAEQSVLANQARTSERLISTMCSKLKHTSIKTYSRHAGTLEFFIYHVELMFIN